jgi:prephenate dehydrogenase
MRNDNDFDVSRALKRIDPSLVGGHPMRGSLTEKIQREHLLQREDNDPRREMLTMCRDMVISIMGCVSAMVPMVIAFQSIMGS